jgi:hypothetical protein
VCKPCTHSLRTKEKQKEAEITKSQQREIVRQISSKTEGTATD